jgi:hypothetical protein
MRITAQGGSLEHSVEMACRFCWIAFRLRLSPSHERLLWRGRHVQAA